MEGGRRPRAADARRGRCAAYRCAATGLVIAGLLLLLVGTALAYSEWQAQGKVPQGFGPDLTAPAWREVAGREDEQVVPAEGAVILPPIEVVPASSLPNGRHALVLPLLRRDGVNAGATDAGPLRAQAVRIPRTPSWVEATYSQVPAPPVTLPPTGDVGSADAYPLPYAPEVGVAVPPPESAPSSTPLPTATSTPSPTRYPEASSPPTRIEIPAINLDAPVLPVGWREVAYHGQTMRVWNVADYAAGWHEASALPGQVGNVVLSGHNNIRGEVFRDVVNLEAGAEITVTADGRSYTYVVESKMVIPERGRPIEERLENNRWIGNFADERLTLVTCWPYTSNTHRVIVIARPRR